MSFSQSEPGANLETLVQQGAECLRHKQVDEAIARFCEALKKNPHHYQARQCLGIAFGMKGDVARAVQQLEIALKIDSNVPVTHYNLGLLYQKQGRTAEAIQQMEAALRLKPDYAQAQQALSHLRPLLTVTAPSAGIDARVQAAKAPSAGTVSCRATLKTSGNLLSLITSHDSKLLVTGSSLHEIKIWNLDDGREVNQIKAPHLLVEHLALSPDGKTLAGVCHHIASPGSVYLWSLPEGHELNAMKKPGQYTCTSFSKDGRMLAFGGDDGTLHLWNTTGDHSFRELHGHGEAIECMAFSRTGFLLVTGSADATVRLWSMPGGNALKCLPGHETNVKCLAINSVGNILATGSTDTTIRLWTLPHGQGIKTLEGHTGEVNCLAISHDDRTLATGSDDGTIWLWHLPDGRPYRALEGHSDGIISLSFSPSGRFLATGSRDNTVRIWDLFEGSETLLLSGHESSVGFIRFGADGETLITGSYDGTVKLWQTPESSEGKSDTQAATANATSLNGEESQENIPGRLPVKAVARTGDPYVDGCFQLGLAEIEETRVWKHMPEATAIVDAEKAGKLDEAWQLAETLRQQQPDFDFPYIWLSQMALAKGDREKAQEILAAGLHQAKSKWRLCSQRGEVAWRADNLSEAVHWWIKSVIIQIETDQVGDYDPFLYLSSIAAHLGQLDASACLLHYSSRIKAGASLPLGVASKLSAATHKQGNIHMRQAFEVLYQEFLA